MLWEGVQQKKMSSRRSINPSEEMCFHRRRQMWKMLLFLFMCHFFGSRVSFTFTLAPHSLIFNNKACKSSPKQQQYMPDNSLFFNTTHEISKQALIFFYFSALLSQTSSTKYNWVHSNICVCLALLCPPAANRQCSMAEAEFLKQHVHTCESVSSTSLRSTARHETAAWEWKPDRCRSKKQKIWRSPAEKKEQKWRNAFTNRFY